MNGNSPSGGSKNEKDKIEALALAAKQNDTFAFVELTGCFSPYISYLARSFRLPESEYDDLCQVGRIALYRAVGSYDEKRSSFTTFAKVCIKNAMTSLTRTYQADNKLSADSLSLDDPDNNEDSPVSDPAHSPENLLLAGEFISRLEGAMRDCLSETERQVLSYKLSGIGIAEISVMTGKPTKSVENTLFRARKKLRAALDGDISGETK